MISCSLETAYRGAVTSEANIAKLADASRQESLDKERRLLEFYEQPFGANSGPWHLPQIHWNYLREFKPVGKKRKDKTTEDIMHELNPLLELATYLKADFLPDAVTFQTLDGTKTPLPPEQQSIALLWSTGAIHDRDEDDPDASRDTFIEYSNDHITDLDEVKKPEEELMRAETLFLADVLDAITFGRRVRQTDGSVLKLKTHGNDLARYNRALKEFWPAIGYKPLDRVRGQATRYSRVPVGKFTPSKHLAYHNETTTLFMESQPIEDSMARFPQLSSYFDVVNNQMRVALVTLGAMTKYHPDLNVKEHARKGVYNPETAEVTIHRQLDAAMRAAPMMPHDVCAMSELLEGFKAEADRQPTLQPIVDQIQRQLQPYLQQLAACPDPQCLQRPRP